MKYRGIEGDFGMAAAVGFIFLRLAVWLLIAVLVLVINMTRFVMKCLDRGFVVLPVFLLFCAGLALVTKLKLRVTIIFFVTGFALSKYGLPRLIWWMTEKLEEFIDFLKRISKFPTPATASSNPSKKKGQQNTDARKGSKGSKPKGGAGSAGKPVERKNAESDPDAVPEGFHEEPESLAVPGFSGPWPEEPKGHGELGGSGETRGYGGFEVPEWPKGFAAFMGPQESSGYGGSAWPEEPIGYAAFSGYEESSVCGWDSGYGETSGYAGFEYVYPSAAVGFPGYVESSAIGGSAWTGAKPADGFSPHLLAPTERVDSEIDQNLDS
jgi:hypothetical protein